MLKICGGTERHVQITWDTRDSSMCPLCCQRAASRSMLRKMGIDDNKKALRNPGVSFKDKNILISEKIKERENFNRDLDELSKLNENGWGLGK